VEKRPRFLSGFNTLSLQSKAGRDTSGRESASLAYLGIEPLALHPWHILAPLLGNLKMHSSCQQARDCTTSTNNDVLHHALRPNEVHELKSSTSSSLLTSRLFSTARDRPARLTVSIPSQQQTNWSLLTHPSFQPACAPRTYPSMDHAHAVSEIGENPFVFIFDLSEPPVELVR
jgi:hypothetical protein